MRDDVIMSIREQVEDAIFLRDNRRYLGALTVLMLAVAASSKKHFPRGAMSIENPKKKMGDSEAFTLFLGGRFRRILLSDNISGEHANSGIRVSFRGESYDLVEILYKFYRCELVHEAKLPQDVEFGPPDNSDQEDPSAIEGNRLSLPSGDKMVLDYGLIDLLLEAVVGAPCNGEEFGIEHFELVPLDNVVEDEFLAALMATRDITRGRFNLMKRAVALISPAVILASDDATVSEYFANLVRNGRFSGGEITGLSSVSLTTRAGRLQRDGIAVMRKIAGAFERVQAWPPTS